MSLNNTFELSVRKEDLLNLYKDQIEFKLFSKAYAGRIFFIGVALILGTITFVASFYESKYVFYALLFAAGIVYCVYDIWKSYSTIQNKKSSVEHWANDVLKFKTHQLSFTDAAIVYKRDEETFTYPFADIHTYNAGTYFQILVNDGSELLVPASAFADQEYLNFVQAVNDKNRKKDTRPWFKNTSFTTLTIEKFQSISNHKVIQSVTISDTAVIQSLVHRIEQIDPNGDMMVSWGPDAQHTSLTFKKGELSEVVEIYEGKLKTPSTGFHGRNEEETILYQKIQDLLKASNS